MPLYSTLYYPNAGINSRHLIQTGLILWDEMQFISPFERYHDNFGSNDKSINRAKELLVKPYLPTDLNKKTAHEIIISLANSDLPEIHEGKKEW